MQNGPSVSLFTDLILQTYRLSFQIPNQMRALVIKN